MRSNGYAQPTDVDAEVRAWQELEDLRWGVCGDVDRDGEIECPHCGVTGRSYYLRPEDGFSRKTARGSVSYRRVWKCGACRRQFSVLTGTGLAGAKLSAVDILEVMVVWIELAENERRRPTWQDLKRVLPHRDTESALRAWHRVACCAEGDQFLRTYRDWNG